MYKAVYYQNSKGEEPVKQFIDAFKTANGKNARLNYTKVMYYIQLLEEYGTVIGKPYIDSIKGTYLFELRPLRNRIFFAYWKDDQFVLLHHFQKKTNKTPPIEVEQANRNWQDWKERNGE